MAELEIKKLLGTQNGALRKEVDFSLGKVLITEKSEMNKKVAGFKICSVTSFFYPRNMYKEFIMC